MSDLILPSLVTAMAHKRLRESANMLRNKLSATFYDVRRPDLSRLDAQPVDKSRVEYDMLALIASGEKMLKGHSPTSVPAGLDIGGLGKFAVLGSSGFSWGDYGSRFKRNASGLSGAMRRGSFDPNFSSVSVPSTQFAIRVGQLARAQTGDRQEILEIDAFVSGMLSSVAHDFVVGPVARGLRADVNSNRHSRRGIPGVSRAAHLTLETVFGGTRGAGTWQSWWPKKKDVPDALYEGYVDAASEVYGFLTTAPIPGYASFLADFDAPPALTEDELRRAVSLLTQDVKTQSWGAGNWYLALLPAILSVPAALLLGKAGLEPADGFFAEEANSTALGGLQLYSLASGLSSVTPGIVSMYLWGQVPDHGRVFISALVTGIVRLISAGLSTTFAATGHSGAAWTFLAFQIAADAYSMISGFIDLGLGNAGDAFVGLFNSMPFVFGLLGLGLGAAFEAMPQDEPYQFWLPWAGFTLLLGGLGLIPAIMLGSGNGVAGLFEELSGGSVAAGPATFDDTTLMFDDALVTGIDRLAGARHATDGNHIVRLWWEGSDDLTIEHDDNRIMLRQTDGTETEIVLGPHEADPASIVTLLTGALADLKAEVVDAPNELGLAWPRSLKDPGDDEPSTIEHDTKATDPQPVGTTKEDAYVLRSAPRAVIATRTGLRPSADQAHQKIGFAPASSAADNSALGLASDLAAMLISGAAPSLRGATAGADVHADPAIVGPVLTNPGLGPVHQVFRNWNLDERRLNEWQRVVSGGAAIEKQTPATHDPLMRPLDPGASPYLNAAPGGNDLLNDMGWIPTWRAWLRVATDITADAAAPAAERYTPSVARRDGTVRPPTNQELSDAMRFLFDLQ